MYLLVADRDGNLNEGLEAVSIVDAIAGMVWFL